MFILLILLFCVVCFFMWGLGVMAISFLLSLLIEYWWLVLLINIIGLIVMYFKQKNKRKNDNG